jgi:DegV family protein with EDD domain
LNDKRFELQIEKVNEKERISLMKEKIAVLTDSSSCIYTSDTPFDILYDNLFMIDIQCYIGEEVFTNFAVNKDTVFYQALKNTKQIAKTSQPSVGETLEKFEYIKSLGYTDLIYLPISKELSGTYHNGFISKDMIEGLRVEIVDTKTTVSILGRMAFEAAKFAKQGVGVQEIIRRVSEIREKSGYYVSVNDLTSLVKNGRLSISKSIIANLLKIKPVIQLTSEGKLASLKNVRTFKSAIKEMINIVGEKVDPKNGEIHLAYTNNTEEMEFTKKLILEKFPQIKVIVYPVASTIAAHLGLAAIGIGYMNY